MSVEVEEEVGDRDAVIVHGRWRVRVNEGEAWESASGRGRRDRTRQETGALAPTTLSCFFPLCQISFDFSKKST